MSEKETAKIKQFPGSLGPNQLLLGLLEAADKGWFQHLAVITIDKHGNFIPHYTPCSSQDLLMAGEILRLEALSSLSDGTYGETETKED